jgi:predicted phosphodiesterase
MRLPRRRHAAVLASLLLVFLFLRSSAPSLRAWLAVQGFHLRYQHHHLLYALGSASLLSKEPLVQVIGQNTYEIVFEVRHDCTTEPVTVQLEGTTIAIPAKLFTDRDREAFVYRALLTNLHGAAFRYNIKIGAWTSRAYLCAAFGGVAETPTWRLGVLGDNQFAAVIFTRMLYRMARQKRLDGMVHVGDAVQTAASARGWSTDFFMPVASTRLNRLAWLLARGNHDAPSAYGMSQESANLMLPGNVCLLVLDSNSQETTQETWLRDALTTAPCSTASKRIVVVHIPPIVEYWDKQAWTAGGESAWGEVVRERYVPLFEQHAVDLVFSGHQHNYQRGQREGVMYVTTGGAGGTIDLERVVDAKDSVMNVTRLVHHFGVLELHDGILSYTMLTLNGDIQDEFRL